MNAVYLNKETTKLSKPVKDFICYFLNNKFCFARLLLLFRLKRKGGYNVIDVDLSNYIYLDNY